VTYAVLLHPKTAKELRELDDSMKSRVKEGLQELSAEPKQAGKLLNGSKFWSLRIGDYGVICEVHDELERVVVLFIGHRRDVYEEFSRLI
jgi:mRNA interferase RelE/StbE